GGGGVGPAWQRDVEAVREDVRNGIVTVEAALKTYKVAIDPVTFEVDAATTKQLRDQAASGADSAG
ncbi:MAG: hydantoinase B/oxoprolinase family protein, partial [Chloroflexi bacterium]|nr:hydantoinase B/oxoprolinase family protein [Chloroflexota bacterium]